MSINPLLLQSDISRRQWRSERFGRISAALLTLDETVSTL